MGVFMVERNLKGISMEALAGAQAAAIANSDGGPVTSDILISPRV